MRGVGGTITGRSLTRKKKPRASATWIEAALSNTRRLALAKPERKQPRVPSTGGCYYWHRCLSAQLGRFLSRDPIGYRAGVHLYAYVENAPVTRSDPTGLVPGGAGYSICCALVRALRGCTCGALEAFCRHIGRHPGDFDNNWLKMCLELHNTVCMAQSVRHRFTKAILRRACEQLYK